MLYMIPYLSAVAIKDLHSLMQHALFGVSKVCYQTLPIVSERLLWQLAELKLYLLGQRDILQVSWPFYG
jgi:hypothetical protein